MAKAKKAAKKIVKKASVKSSKKVVAKVAKKSVLHKEVGNKLSILLIVMAMLVFVLAALSMTR